MTSEELIAVRCGGCGQVFRVPPQQEERRAKCRGCGHEFTIPVTPPSQVRKRSGRPARRRLISAPDARLAAACAANIERLSQRNPYGDSNRGARWRLLATAVALLGATVGSIAYFGFAPKGVATQAEHLERGRVAKLAAPRTEFEFESLADLIESVEPSIVQINTNRGVGSGFVIDPAGLIVTCDHCVDRTLSAQVTFANGDVLPVVGLRATRPGSDLAVLQVAPKEPLPALPLAHVTPRKGEPVVSFGSPAGLSFTVSEGSVSALRTVDEVMTISDRLRGGGSLDLDTHCELVQFTATSMPGHSGGPIVNYRGNVIGVTSFALPYQRRSFEFAISYHEIRYLVSQLNEAAVPLKDCWPADPEELEGLTSDDPRSGVDYD